MLSLAEVMRRHWPAYEQQFGARILPSQRRAAQAIMKCRTQALGGEVYACTKCGKIHYVYHSCNHRACPQCGNADATEWIQEQKRRLLPTPYYLITFTVPEGLRAWLRSHQKPGYLQLLKQSAASLQDVAGRDKYLGGELGILSVLHTWGRQLQYHPHVHCVVPALGLRKNGLSLCHPKSATFFLPQIVLAARFRTRLKLALLSQPDTAEIPDSVWKQKWVVDVQPAGTGEPALKYLSAYVYRTALGSQRLIADTDGIVTFKYKDSEDQHWHTLSLSAPEFIRRFLQHVLPKGFQRVRHYGWLSPAAKKKWKRILALLDYKPPDNPQTTQGSERRCPDCGGTLKRLGTLIWYLTLKPP